MNTATKATRDGRIIPAILYDFIKNTQNRGGKIFWSFPDEYHGCPNCNGTGHVSAELVTGGPYDSPVSVRQENVSEPAVSINGRWYKTKRHSYQCPVCGGSSGMQAGATGTYPTGAATKGLYGKLNL